MEEENPAEGLAANDIIGGLDAPRTSRSRRGGAAQGGAAAAKPKPLEEEAELSDF